MRPINASMPMRNPPGSAMELSSSQASERRRCSRGTAASSRSAGAVLANGAEAGRVRIALLDTRQGSVQSGCECGLSIDEILPAELLPFALALRGHLHTFRRERDHIGLALDLDLALQGFFQFGGHGILVNGGPSLAPCGTNPVSWCLT